MPRHADSERDRLMILMAYRHGLRVSELIALTWRQIDLDAARLRVLRAKGSEDGVHPLSGREIRALRAVRRHQTIGCRWIFVTSRGGTMTRNGFYKLLEKAATRAGVTNVHPHLLRHGCGFQAGEPGHEYAVARRIPWPCQRAEHQAICAYGRGPVRRPLARLTCGSGVSAVQRIKREMTAAAVAACLFAVISSGHSLMRAAAAIRRVVEAGAAR